MLIKEAMTPSPVCCKPGDKLDTVAKLMLEHDCGEIPVCDGSQIVGVITDRDIVCRAVAADKLPAAIAASEVMTRNVYTIVEDDEIDAALDLMDQMVIHRLPVVDDSGKLVGIVSEADLMAKAPAIDVARAVRKQPRMAL
jgi:CBS domain-containing protein